MRYNERCCGGAAVEQTTGPKTANENTVFDHRVRKQLRNHSLATQCFCAGLFCCLSVRTAARVKADLFTSIQIPPQHLFELFVIDWRSPLFIILTSYVENNPVKSFHHSIQFAYVNLQMFCLRIFGKNTLDHWSKVSKMRVELSVRDIASSPQHLQDFMRHSAVGTIEYIRRRLAKLVQA